jgi:membrane protein YdbS with pleckstrin-like domain
VKKRTYEKTEYRFYKNRLEYYEGFFNIEEKSISYDRITEVGLRKGILQRQYGLGTITLSTPATGVSANRAGRSGIRVADIENPDEIYTEVKRLIKSHSV